MTTTALLEAPAPVLVRAALVGNPNTGKTTLFNALCAARAMTSNYPGTTTTIRTGFRRSARCRLEVIDLPGLYDLHHESREGRIVREVLHRTGADAPDVVVMVADACNLTRNLVLAGEVLAAGRRVVLALNMVDLARRRGVAIDTRVLASRLQTPVVPIVARSHEGLDRLRDVVAQVSGDPPRARPDDLPQCGATLEEWTAWSDAIARLAIRETRPAAGVDRWTDRLDRVFTHPVLGLAIFLAVMGGLFWGLFACAAVPMQLIEAVFARLGTAVEAIVPAGPIRDLLADGIIGGIAGTVVFLPQICLLFFLISLLEDTGYLARAAFVTDNLLSRFGLPGHAFVPLLTSHACAVPGIMSARLIPDPRDRLATILVAPFMSCSARLPVYVLLTSLLFAGRPMLAAVAFAGCYVLGASAGLLTARLFGRTVLKGRPGPMILELPSYRAPSLINALLTAKDQGLAFLRSAGTVIVAICIVMWWLSAYPRSTPSAAADPGTRAALTASYAGQMGRAIEPVFRPLGFDWQLTVGVLTSFMAREVFVSTMTVLAGDVGEAEIGVVDRISRMPRDDGGLVFTPATAASALVFFVLAMQCLPTLTVTRQETGRARYAAMQFAYMFGLAYLAALVLHQGLLAIGVP